MAIILECLNVLIKVSHHHFMLANKFSIDLSGSERLSLRLPEIDFMNYARLFTLGDNLFLQKRYREVRDTASSLFQVPPPFQVLLIYSTPIWTRMDIIRKRRYIPFQVYILI